MTLPGWRALGVTWAGILALALGGGLWLERLGPPAVAPAAGLATAEAASEAGQAPAPARPASPPPASPASPPPAAAIGAQAAAPADPLQPGAPAPAAAPTAPPPTAPPGSAAEPSPAAAPAATPPGPAPRGAAGIDPAPRGAAGIDPAPRGAAWIDPALSEAGPHGPLPRISADGRTPIRTYGRPFDRSDTRPRIAIIMGDIGLNAAQSDDALRRLPPAVSLAITPYGYGLPAWSERARERGAETLIAIPMEPAGFPMNDPGDRALLVNQPLPENLDRLAWALSRTQGYVGAIGAIGGMRGERFASISAAFATMQEILQSRGLLYIDPRPAARSPTRAWGRTVDAIIDEPATRGEIERRLARLEALARERGSALGLAGSPTPVVVDRIAAWAATLDAKGLVLAPASVLIRRPEAIAPPEPPRRTP